MRAFKLGIAYFVVVFAIGFGLGVVRVLWLVPALGERRAELLEIPLMVAACYLVARLLLSRIDFALPQAGALVMGAVALALLLAAELSVVPGLRGLSIAQYFAERDPISGAAYFFSLVIFMLMPWLMVKRAKRA